jgi:hypothetical protein
MDYDREYEDEIIRYKICLGATRDQYLTLIDLLVLRERQPLL